MLVVVYNCNSLCSSSSVSIPSIAALSGGYPLHLLACTTRASGFPLKNMPFSVS